MAGNQVRNETDQFSNDSELMTKEEEETEEKSLAFLEGIADCIRKYVNTFREIKTENKQNKDHQMTGNEFWVEVFQNDLSCQKTYYFITTDEGHVNETW